MKHLIGIGALALLLACSKAEAPCAEACEPGIPGLWWLMPTESGRGGCFILERDEGKVRYSPSHQADLETYGTWSCKDGAFSFGAWGKAYATRGDVGYLITTESLVPTLDDIEGHLHTTCELWKIKGYGDE